MDWPFDVDQALTRQSTPITVYITTGGGPQFRVNWGDGPTIQLMAHSHKATRRKTGTGRTASRRSGSKPVIRAVHIQDNSVTGEFADNGFG